MRAAFLPIVLLFSTAVSAIEFAQYDPVRHQFALEGKVHYYVEEYNEQQPHEALELLQKGHFTKANSARLSLGYTSKAIWVAVPVAQLSAKSDRLILEITALIDSIQFNYLNERGLRLESFVTGRDMPLSSRPLEHHNFVFPITLERGSRGYVLMRLMSQGSMLVPLKLLPESEFYQGDRLELLIFGIYFGIMAVMVLYNLFLYAATRERSYAFYVFYILFFLLFQFALWGFFHELILPESPQVAKYALPVFLHLATIFQLLFAAQFFQAKEIIPRLYKISGDLSFATFLSLLAGGVTPYRWFITLGIFTGSGGALLIFLQALVLYIRRQKVARFFLIAYTTLIGGVVFLALRNMGVINYSFISSYSAQIGSALEVILLSLALADRINIWRDEKDKAQKQVIDREREMNRTFQLFVPQKFLELAGETDFTKLELGKSSTREITILFSDIRQFTSLSEAMTPEQNFKFLNSYLSRMGPIIRQHGGFIDKFIGDAIMALFPETQEGVDSGTGRTPSVSWNESHGGPRAGAAMDGVFATAESHGGPRAGAAMDGVFATAESHGMPRAGAANAAQAALAMLKELKAYNTHRATQGYKPVDIGIGIHTGMVRLGTIGENERWEGTVIGDTVNLASRIENLSSTFNAPIVVSEAVLKTLPAEQLHRELDTIRVKGKQKAVKVYEIIADL